MKKPFDFRTKLAFAGLAICLVGFGLLLWNRSNSVLPVQSSAAQAPSSIYTSRPRSPDGIGKVYLGREIAEVMGHQGADWLERKSRRAEEQPQKLIEALNLAPNDTVAEIGAGTGYITFQIAERVPQGRVIAVDIQPEMIDILKQRRAKLDFKNVEPLLSTEQDPKLSPNSIDLAIMVDAYHEFNYPNEMMSGIVRALKPGGRVALVEYRAEDPRVFIKPHHKMTQVQARKEMSAVGLTWKETLSTLPQQHLMIFTRTS
jgi:ubiquinone/menaquinone biosynthesis C-methylase UbiE